MEKEKFHLIIDMGHGSNTPGKCAPDKSFYEWKFSRKVGKEVGARLAKMGYNVHYTWLEDRDLSCQYDAAQVTNQQGADVACGSSE